METKKESCPHLEKFIQRGGVQNYSTILKFLLNRGSLV